MLKGLFFTTEDRKNKVQVPQRNEMLSICCIILDFTSLKLFKTIFCFHRLLNVLVFENYHSVFSIHKRVLLVLIVLIVLTDMCVLKIIFICMNILQCKPS